MNIARVSQQFYDIAIRVLYSERCFEVDQGLRQTTLKEGDLV